MSLALMILVGVYCAAFLVTLGFSIHEDYDNYVSGTVSASVCTIIAFSILGAVMAGCIGVGVEQERHHDRMANEQAKPKGHSE